MLTPEIIREKLKKAIRSSVLDSLPYDRTLLKKRNDCQSLGGTCVSVWLFGFLYLLTWAVVPFLSSWDNLQEENNYLILTYGIFLLLPLLHKKQTGTLHLSWTDIWMMAIYIWIGLCSTVLNMRILSNPCEVPILPLLGVLLLGILSSKRKTVSSVHPFYGKTLLVPLVVVIGGFALAKYHRTSQVVLSLRDHSALIRYKSFDGYGKEGWFHRNFLLIYSKRLYENQMYGNAVPYLEQLSRLSPVTDVYMDLGRCYQHLRMYKKAEECFTLVSQARPEYVLPYYELFRLYAECGDRGQAQRIGRKILSKDFHRDSSLLDEARRNVRLYLDRLDSDNPFGIYGTKTQNNKIIPFKCE